MMYFVNSEVIINLSHIASIHKMEPDGEYGLNLINDEAYVLNSSEYKSLIDKLNYLKMI